MRKVKLTQGQVTQVDNDMFEYLNQFNWYANYYPGTRSYYAVRRSPRINGKQSAILMARMIMNAPKGMQVDHINHDTLDNQKSNLRLCTASQNLMNRSSYKNSTSKYKGVSWNKNTKKWFTKIRLNGKQIYLGYFDIEEDGAKAYDEAAIRHFGEFKNLNFPQLKTEQLCIIF